MIRFNLFSRPKLPVRHLDVDRKAKQKLIEGTGRLAEIEADFDVKMDWARKLARHTLDSLDEGKRK